jgi:acyl-CoA thioester hydrolase
MQKLIWERPATYPFETDIELRIGDINYGQHVGHDTMLSLLHEARVRFLQAAGFSESDIGGCGLIMRDATLVFHEETTYPATLRCGVAMADVARTGFDLHYRVMRLPAAVLVAEAKTGMVCFDYNRHRPARMPDLFRQAVAHRFVADTCS